LINAVDSLPPMRMVDRDDLIHIGISAWRSGETVPQVMENVEMATRRAALQGGNSWSVGEGNTLDMGRGSVRWRTLLETRLIAAAHVFTKTGCVAGWQSAPP
jgi:diguanylate cyclase/phosphodiesterase